MAVARHADPVPALGPAAWGGGVVAMLAVVAAGGASDRIPRDLLPALAVWAVVATALAIHDAHHQRIHTATCWAGTALTVAMIAVAGAERLAGAAMAVAFLAGYCLLAWLVRPAALGFGDVRYAVLAATAPGAVAGGFAGITILLIACLTALGAHIVSRVTSRWRSGATIAFAPYLAAGAAATLLVGG